MAVVVLPFHAWCVFEHTRWFSARLVVAERAVVRGVDGEGAVLKGSIVRLVRYLYAIPSMNETYTKSSSWSVVSGGGGGEQIILLFSKHVGE